MCPYSLTLNEIFVKLLQTEWEKMCMLIKLKSCSRIRTRAQYVYDI